jgi:lambda repressor-like predicted transcriptional regulator
MPQDEAPILVDLKQRVHDLAHGIRVAHHAYDHFACPWPIVQSDIAAALDGHPKSPWLSRQYYYW